MFEQINKLKQKQINKKKKRVIEETAEGMALGNMRGGATGWCSSFNQVEVGTGIRNLTVAMIAKLHNFLKKDDVPPLPIHQSIN